MAVLGTWVTGGLLWALAIGVPLADLAVWLDVKRRRRVEGEPVRGPGEGNPRVSDPVGRSTAYPLRESGARSSGPNREANGWRSDSPIPGSPT